MIPEAARAASEFLDIEPLQHPAAVSIVVFPLYLTLKTSHSFDGFLPAPRLSLRHEL